MIFIITDMSVDSYCGLEIIFPSLLTNVEDSLIIKIRNRSEGRFG